MIFANEPTVSFAKFEYFKINRRFITIIIKLQSNVLIGAPIILTDGIPISMYPKMMMSAGLSYAGIIDKLVEYAVKAQ